MEASSFGRGLAWLMVPAAAALVVSALSLPRHAYTGLTLRDTEVVSVAPGSPGERAGMRPGDQVRTLAAPGRGGPFDPGPLGALVPGVPVTLTRERAGVRAPVWLAPEPLPDGERRFKALLFAVASGFLLLGGWVWSERRDRLTRAFFLLCVAFAGLLAPPPRLDDPSWRALYDISYLVVQLVLPALFVHFFTLFPEPPPRRQGSFAVRFAWGVSLSLLVIWATALAAAAAGAPRVSEALPWLQAASGLWFAAGLLAGLLLFALARARSRTRDARRRLRVAFVGTLLGAAPFAVLVALRNLAPGAPLPGERWSVVLTLLVPASFAWAIAVHRVFDFRVALRAVAGLAAALVASAALYAGGEWLAATWYPELGAGVAGLSLAFLALGGALAGPLRRGLGSLGARVVPIADELSLATWSPRLEHTRDGGVESLLASACAAAAQALRLDGCSAVRLEAGEPRVCAHAGRPMVVPLTAPFADTLLKLRGVVALEEAELAAEDRDALESATVHWLLPVPAESAPAALLLGRRLAGPWLDRHEIRDLTRFSEHVAVALENAELRREVRSHGALERELMQAGEVQAHRLPRRAPVYPTLDCAAAALSTEPVGGDYYDFAPAGPREFTLAVGDAAGHGVPAALVLAGVQARFRDFASRSRGPGHLLESMNDELVAIDHPEKFMALLCARVDVTNGMLRLANGGLPPPLLRRADGRYEELDDSGLLLGVRAGAAYATTSVELHAGDVVVLHTDGLTEAQREGELFGAQGVRDVLERCARRRAADVLEELLRAVRSHADKPLDDLTVVVLKQLTEPAGGRGRGHGKPLKFAGAGADTNR